MPTENASTTTFYTSIYHHGVDDKRRLQIPAKWRPAEESFQFTMILWPGSASSGSYLLFLPPEPLHLLMEKLKAMPYSDPTAHSLRRLLGTKSDRVTVDKGGRICLPEMMAKGAGIESDAVLVGSWDRFEVWNPERYKAVSKVDEALEPEAFKLI